MVNRKKLLIEALSIIEQLETQYAPTSPAFTLLFGAKSDLKAIKYMEDSKRFPKELLRAKTDM